MRQNNRAMSGIITTIIIIGIAISAVGIVWYVLNGVLTGQTENIAFSEKCLDVNLQPTSVNCTGIACTVRIKRSAGGEAIGGVKAIFYYADGHSEVEDSSGDIGELATVSKTFTLTSAGANKVEISSYFTDETGEKQVCPQAAYTQI